MVIAEKVEGSIPMEYSPVPCKTGEPVTLSGLKISTGGVLNEANQSAMHHHDSSLRGSYLAV